MIEELKNNNRDIEVINKKINELVIQVNKLTEKVEGETSMTITLDTSDEEETKKILESVLFEDLKS